MKSKDIQQAITNVMNTEPTKIWGQNELLEATGLQGDVFSKAMRLLVRRGDIVSPVRENYVEESQYVFSSFAPDTERWVWAKKMVWLEAIPPLSKDLDQKSELIKKLARKAGDRINTKDLDAVDSLVLEFQAMQKFYDTYFPQLRRTS
ncbi:MAG: hypothetical protein CMH98_11225 [Oceanospirillaceae bacterium]|nr:hypothetical protein [Oceanospirillaceae bacterium]